MMWRTPRNRDDMLKRAIEFTADCERYGAAMMRVISEWPISCEQNLTNLSQNRKAWIGHAACALEMEFSECVVREAWGYLTDDQRRRANRKAKEAILEWERCQSENLELMF